MVSVLHHLVCFLREYIEYSLSLIDLCSWRYCIDPRLWSLCGVCAVTETTMRSKQQTNTTAQSLGIITYRQVIHVQWSTNPLIFSPSYFSQEATSTRRVRGGWVSEDEGVVFWSVGGQGLKPPFEALPLRKLGLQKLPVRTNTERKKHENRRQQQLTRNSCTCEHTAENPSRFVTFYFLFLA